MRSAGKGPSPPYRSRRAASAARVRLHRKLRIGCRCERNTAKRRFRAQFPAGRANPRSAALSSRTGASRGAAHRRRTGTRAAPDRPLPIGERDRAHSVLPGGSSRAPRGDTAALPAFLPAGPNASAAEAPLLACFCQSEEYGRTMTCACDAFRALLDEVRFDSGEPEIDFRHRFGR